MHMEKSTQKKKDALQFHDMTVAIHRHAHKKHIICLNPVKYFRFNFKGTQRWMNILAYPWLYGGTVLLILLGYDEQHEPTK
jgi:hypothetical protein